MGNRIAITHEAKAKLAEAFQSHEAKEQGWRMSFCVPSLLVLRWFNGTQRFFQW